MLRMMANLELYLDDIMGLRSGQRLLIVSDTYARPLAAGRLMLELALARGIEAVWTVMQPRTHQGHEPPGAVARAMRDSDAIFEIAETADCTHTTARKEASEAGAKYYLTMTGVSEDYLKKQVSRDDLHVIKTRTDRLAEMLSQTREARVTTPFGTDVTMSLEGRPGLSLHPLRDAAVSMLPDYAEAAVSPVEGSARGMIVADTAVQEWGHTLREPLRLTVAGGRVTAVAGGPDDVARFEALIATDENAANCAELGIGTSHTISSRFTGSVWDFALLGTVHLAVGRNNDIGGATWSRVHKDVLMTLPTVSLDGRTIMTAGRLQGM